ncbi:MAG: zinc ABC transporter substrate-binding protein [Chloroflexota bacterium]|nr:zinc ABC transporter substrate-binding protein [Chloroflexota bacterium]
MLVTLLVGCAASPGGPATGAAGEKLRAVTTITVFADLVRNVGGDRVTVDALVPAGRDVHTFDPSPSDARKIADAKLLVLNGLGLDDWIEGAATSAGAANVSRVRLAEDLPDTRYLPGAHEDGANNGESSPQADENDPSAGAGGAANPHLWLNVAYARKYVARLAASLAQLAPDASAAFAANAAAYAARLAALDSWVREQMASVPAEHRKVVSQHDAFPYFAHAYGIDIVDVVVDSPGQEPSARKLAQVVDAIRRSGARGVITEAQFNRDLAARIAAEAGATIIGDLYSDSLGPPPADSYEGIIRYDVERIVEALK